MIAGVIAEFNPFHNGHKYLIDQAKNDGFEVFCVISGNFVQRGDVAVIPKFERSQAALKCGADLVAELPCPWSMSTAQNFAIGGVSQLNALGVDVLYFGSECGDINKLTAAAEILSSNEFSNKIKNNLSSNETFASIRQNILSETDAELGKILDNPNDSLAVEYIIAAKKINKSLRFKAIKRVGALHNDKTESGAFSTATLLREDIKNNRIRDFEEYMPEEAYSILKSSPTADISRLETAILSKLRTMSLEELKMTPDISEGIENLIYDAIKESETLDELYSKTKTKRYTLARIRRIVLSAYIGIDNSYFKQEPPYVRVLGFRGNAISDCSIVSKKPIITRVSQIEQLDAFSKKVFATECRATDLYALACDKKRRCGNEYTAPMIKLT